MIEALVLESLNLEAIIASEPFKRRITEIRDLTFRDYSANGKLESVREYGFTVGIGRRDSSVQPVPCISEVVQGTTQYIVRRPMFYLNGLELLDLHSHKIIGGGDMITLTPKDSEAWQKISRHNWFIQNVFPRNQKLDKYNPAVIGVIIYFYSPDEIGMQIYRFILQTDLRAYWANIANMIRTSELTIADFRNEVGAVALALYSDRLPNVTGAMHKCAVSQLYLPSNISAKFPLLLPESESVNPKASSIEIKQ